MTERVAGGIGIAACAVFWVALFAFGASRTDYSHFHKAVSELGVLGAPHALAWNLIGFIVPGLLLALFGAGLATAIDGRRGALWWLLVLSGLCFAATGVVPGEMRNGSPMMESPLTLGHLLLANLAPLLWAIASFLVIRRVKKNRSWKPFTTLAAVYAVVCVGGFLFSIVASAAIPGLADMPGLVQRFDFAFYFGWFLIMSFHLRSAVPRVRLASA
ncbi:MAG TPA: DUF998 domain-containing protein [Vicinamibacterales bacterium]|nr:DUF998 domain-containing protein [Vicinamibacterales bacterium]